MIDSTTGLILATVLVGGVAYYALKQSKEKRKSIEKPRKVGHSPQIKPFEDPFKSLQEKILDKNYGQLTKTAHFV